MEGVTPGRTNVAGARPLSRPRLSSTNTWSAAASPLASKAVATAGPLMIQGWDVMIQPKPVRLVKNTHDTALPTYGRSILLFLIKLNRLNLFSVEPLAMYKGQKRLLNKQISIFVKIYKYTMYCRKLFTVMCHLQIECCTAFVIINISTLKFDQIKRSIRHVTMLCSDYH